MILIDMWPIPWTWYAPIMLMAVWVAYVRSLCSPD